MDADRRAIVENRITPHTRKQYVYCLKRAGREIDTDEDLCAYITKAFEAGKSPGSLQNIVNAIRWDCERRGKPDPRGFLTKHKLTQLRREGRTRARGQAKGMQWGEVEALCRLLDRDSSMTGQRDSALISMMSDGLLRVGEVPGIRVEDVLFIDDGASLVLRHSKTDQEGAGAVLFLGPPTAKRIRAWLDVSGITEGLLFPRVFIGCKRQGGKMGGKMTAEGIRQMIKRRCKAAGFEGITGHSFRVGSAQSLAASGASLVQMQNAGRWTSPEMPAHYSKMQAANRGAVARLKYGQ